MNTHRVLLAGVAAMACLAPVSIAASNLASKPAKKHREFYVALGDSLSRGAQPNTSGQTVLTHQGYADDIYAAEKKEVEDLTLEDLGCLGETTSTMIKGGICKYSGGSQLKAALAFLRMHRGHIAFVTIDIGANDIDKCVSSTTANITCITQGETSIVTNLPKIAAALRKAAGGKVPIVGMTYYDPLLAAWFEGPNGQAVAAESQQIARSVNGDIASSYSSHRVKVAAVGAAFQTYRPLTDTETFQGRRVPAAVVEVCKLTWTCARSPLGPNIHANAAGYRRIAAAFEKKRL